MKVYRVTNGDRTELVEAVDQTDAVQGFIELYLTAADAATFDYVTAAELPPASDCDRCGGLGRYAVADVENGPDFDVVEICDCPAGERVLAAAPVDRVCVECGRRFETVATDTRTDCHACEHKTADELFRERIAGKRVA